MQITKKEIIQKLYDIEEQEGLKLGRAVQQVVRSEIVPINVISLINKYDKEFLLIYDTYNTIYLSKNRNVNMETINRICEYLHVQPSEIMEWL